MRNQVGSSDGRSIPHGHGEQKFCCDGSSPDDIVISGIAGRFPQSDNVRELKESLYNNVSLICPSEGRWKEGTCHAPCVDYGFMKNIDKFDAEFFNIPPCISRNMECEQRILMEVLYEAIADAGYDPYSLQGKTIAVYNACSNCDGRDIFYHYEEYDAYSGIGFLTTLRANRFSYALNLKGPNAVVDASCSSAAVALEFAVRDVMSGRCEAALVCGAQIVCNPQLNHAYTVTGMLSKTGYCRSFDAKADGIARADGVAALYIQKASTARRIYAKVLGQYTMSVGYASQVKPSDVYIPTKVPEMELFKKATEVAKVDPLEISYIEAHGVGNPTSDSVEADVVAEYFCANRKEPLFIGSIKSNIGHSESASGLMGIIKCILAFETGVIPANLHYEIPNPKSEALKNQKVKVVTRNSNLPGPVVAVNCFGFSGIISQIILKRNTMTKKKEEEKSGSVLPQLALYCASCEDAVRYALDLIIETRPNREFFPLLHGLADSSPNMKPYRGYALLGEEPVSEIKRVENTKRQVWFIFTGMGCQYPGMAHDLMQIKVFADTIHRCAKALEPFGIDLLALLEPDTDHFLQQRKILPAFVAICAIQIALTDVLRAIGIEPDGIIGHSTGEMACAYADGCCTAEEVMLCSYWRGRSVEEGNLVQGKMAAVGLSWEEAKRRCPENVYPACNNAKDSVTISGLPEPLDNFVEELKNENTFARIVNCYGYGFHSVFVQDCSEGMRSELKKFLLNPKRRTKRWLSTSYHPDEWNKPEAELIDANYFTHNLISSVHFVEALAYVPSDAITIEIAPHYLLQSILKRAIGTDAEYIGLMKHHENNVNHILLSLGKLYNLGLSPNIENLYPAVNYPVPRGTPSVSDFIKWNHSVSWKVLRYNKEAGGTLRLYNRLDEEDSYLMDHCIQGTSLYPAAGYIYLAWKALSEFLDKSVENMPIILEDFKICRKTVLKPKDQKTFIISVSAAEGALEIVENGEVVASGKISHNQSLSVGEPIRMPVNDMEMIDGSSVYDELRINGYESGPTFQCLEKVNSDGTFGFVKWAEKWIPYLDAHLLFFGSLGESTNFYLPNYVRSIKINPVSVMEYISKIGDGAPFKSVPVTYNQETGVCTSPGIEISGLKQEALPRLQAVEDCPQLEKYEFIPNLSSSLLPEAHEECLEYLEICSHMAKGIASSGNDGKDRKYGRAKATAVSEASVDEYLKSSGEKHVLLNTLCEISKIRAGASFLKDVDNAFRKYINNAGNDLIYKSLLGERHFRVILELISENITGKVNAVEVPNGNCSILPVVQNVLRKFVPLKMGIMSVYLMQNEMRESSCNGIQVNGVKLEDSMADVKDRDLVISSFLFGDITELKRHVHSLSLMVHTRGFIVLLHRESISPAEALLCSLCTRTLETQSCEAAENVFKKEGLTVVSKFSDSFGNNLYLLRPEYQEPAGKNLVVKVKDGCYGEWIEQLKRALHTVSNTDGARVWLTAEDSTYSGLIGMVKCIQQESEGQKIRCIFICPDETGQNLPPFDPKNPIFADILRKDLVFNVYCKGNWGSFRHVPIENGIELKQMPHCFMNITKCGDLSSLRWFESPLKYESEDFGKQPLIHVVYSAVNFRDVMYATGRISYGHVQEDIGNDQCVIGSEFSGVTSDGRRVMGSCLNRAIATTIHRPPLLMLDVPHHWTLEDAATVPVVYSTCYFALIVRGRLQKGESILIHKGTSGIGMAAIRIALSLDCEIFTTVGTAEKRAHLKTVFPQLKNENIGCSRDTSFEAMIMRQTKGKGVHVILNSLSGDKLQASGRCLDYHGRFIDVGKYDIAVDNSFGLNVFLKSVEFHGIYLDRLTDYCDFHSSKLRELMEDGLKRGVVQPLDRTVFPSSEAESAFQFMASGKHLGKVLLKIRDGPKHDTVAHPVEYLAQPCLYFYKHKVYIIIGGLGGFGIQLAQWMIDKGACNIILTSRYGARSACQRVYLNRWKKMGVNVIVSVKDIAKKEEANKLLQEAKVIGPVGGIFNSAAVLNDSPVQKQSAKHFEEVCAAKAVGTKNLDELSRKMCPSIDFFVCFSCMTCGAGQMNYGYANSVMERICEKRHRDGLHGLAVQWGIIGDVGFIHKRLGEDAVISGVVPQKVSSCLQSLEQFLLQNNPVVTSYVSITTSKRIVTQLSRILGFSDPSEMNTSKSFQEMGFSPEVGAEVQHALEANCGIKLHMKDLMDMKLNRLRELVEFKEEKKPKVSSQSQ